MVRGLVHDKKIDLLKHELCKSESRSLSTGKNAYRLNNIVRTEKEKRENRISEKAIDTLNQIIPEIGISILYTGRI